MSINFSSLLNAAIPSSGLYFTLNGTVYLPGDTVFTTDIGVVNSPTDPGRSLVCVTSNVNTQCCRGSDGGNVGEWYFPNGTIVPRNIKLNRSYYSSFTRSGFTHQVRLNRRYNSMTTGTYECRVPDHHGLLHTATIELTTAGMIHN